MGSVLMSDEPRLIERLCGGWLAVSAKCEPIKIGVTAQTKDEAAYNYRVTLAQWRLLLKTERKTEGPVSPHGAGLGPRER